MGPLESEQVIYLMRCVTVSMLETISTAQMSLVKSPSMSSKDYLFELTSVLQGSIAKIRNKLIIIFSFLASHISPHDELQGWGREKRNPLAPKSVLHAAWIYHTLPLFRCEILPNQDSFGILLKYSLCASLIIPPPDNPFVRFPE